MNNFLVRRMWKHLKSGDKLAFKEGDETWTYTVRRNGDLLTLDGLLTEFDEEDFEGWVARPSFSKVIKANESVQSKGGSLHDV